MRKYTACKIFYQNHTLLIVIVAGIGPKISGYLDYLETMCKELLMIEYAIHNTIFACLILLSFLTSHASAHTPNLTLLTATEVQNLPAINFLL